MASDALILIGAGGHSKVVVDALASRGVRVTAYVALQPSTWIEQNGISRMDEQQLETLLPQSPQLVMGFVGLGVEALQRRSILMRQYEEKGGRFPPVIHASAIVSHKVRLDAGVQVLVGAVVNADAILEKGAVINTAAVVEHDAVIGAGSHIGPRAVVLGGAKLGRECFIGSNAVIIQQTVVASGSFIKALSIAQ
jgi:sugar O-acyltransferase (sialic acid O-acetyltransferase NeuD family)